jgi:hypothetical protein
MKRSKSCEVAMDGMKIFRSPLLLIFAGVVLMNLILTILVYSRILPQVVQEDEALITLFFLIILLLSLIGVVISPFVASRINKLVRGTVARHTCIALIGAFVGWSILRFTVLGESGMKIMDVVAGSIISGLIFLTTSIVNQLTEKKTKKIRSISLIFVIVLGIILFLVLFACPIARFLFLLLLLGY